jgi:programmed cell death protein 5
MRLFFFLYKSSRDMGEGGVLVNRIRIVKPERVRQVEDGLIYMANSGQLRGPITEPELIALLEQFNQQTQKETKVTFTRRTREDEGD